MPNIFSKLFGSNNDDPEDYDDDPSSRFRMKGETQSEWVARVRAINKTSDDDERRRRDYVNKNLDDGESGLRKANANAAFSAGIIDDKQYISALNDVSSPEWIMTNDGVMAQRSDDGSYERDGKKYDADGRGK
jgi:hypothetical protein